MTNRTPYPLCYALLGLFIACASEDGQPDAGDSAEAADVQVPDADAEVDEGSANDAEGPSPNDVEPEDTGDELDGGDGTDCSDGSGEGSGGCPAQDALACQELGPPPPGLAVCSCPGVYFIYQTDEGCRFSCNCHSVGYPAAWDCYEVTSACTEQTPPEDVGLLPPDASP